jgi:hypothetical protein
MEVVRRFLDGYEAEDVIPALRRAVERLDPEPEAEAVLALWAEDPSYRHVHPEVEWSAGGAVGTTARGAAGVSAWWSEWLETWESYVYRTVELRDVGEWVLATTDLTAEGRGGIPVEMRIFQLFHVRDGKVDVCRVFFSETEAVEAARASA